MGPVNADALGYAYLGSHLALAWPFERGRDEVGAAYKAIGDSSSWGLEAWLD